MNTTRCKNILAACLVVLAVGATDSSLAGPRGSIELDEANELLRAYAAHVVEQQPPQLRRAWRSQLDRVKLSKTGLYVLRPVGGRIVFEYLPKTKTLDILGPIHLFRRRVVKPWVLQALQEAAARGVSTGGGELVYDPAAKGIFLRRSFTKVPASKQDFFKTCDRLRQAAHDWQRKHFLPALNAFYARHAPPASATAKTGGFRATLLLADDVAAFKSVWDRRVTARQPAIWTVSRTTQGKPVHAFVLFSGATPDSRGRSSVKARLRILAPDGSTLADVPNIPLWNGPAPPAKHLQLAVKSLEIKLSTKQPLGTYRIQAEVCDGNGKRCVQLSLPLELAAKR